MSTETHTLQLKIDPTLAEAGAKKFTGAIASITTALAGLEKDASGTFARLSKFKGPEYEVAGIQRATAETARLTSAQAATASASDKAAQTIQRTALASASAVRMAEQATQRLAIRMGDLGDTQGLARLNVALAQMKAGLVNATSMLDVRSSKSAFDDTRSSLLQATVASENLRGAEAQLAREMAEVQRAAATQAATLDNLRAKYNPLYAASMQYAAALEEISMAEREGVITAQLAAAARDQAAARMAGNTAAMDGFKVSAGQAQAAAQQMGYQVNDVITMAAMGASPMQVISSQIFQISQAMDLAGGKAAALGSVKTALLGLLNPSTLAVGAVIGLTTALVQWGIAAFGASETTMTFGEALSDAESKINAISQSTDTLANAKLGSLAEGYGRVNEELRIHLERLAQIAQLEAVSANRNTIQALEDQITGGWLTTDVDDVRIALDTTNDSARHFLGLLGQIKAAKTFDEQAAAITRARQYLESTGVTLDSAEGSAQALLMGLIKAEDSAMRLSHASDESAAAIAGAVGQTSAWANAMAGVAAQISAIASSLSAISGGAIGAASKRVEIAALARGDSLRSAEIARIRHDSELELGARSTAANARGGVGGWVENRLIDMERFAREENIRLDDELNAARDKARKRETASTGGGGRGGGRSRAETLGDEERALSKLTKSMNDRIVSLDSENAALMLLATGQAKTEESARFMADAMAANGGALDDTTMAIVRQYEAASLLNEQLTRLARDPVKEWMDSVPDWATAAKDIQASMTETFSTTLADVLKTGSFDATAFADALFAPVFDAIAQKATKELFTALGATDGSLFGGVFESLGLASMGDPEMAAGSQQAGATIATSMVQAGGQVAAQIQAAMTGAGAQAGAAVRAGGQQGLAIGANNIRTAATTGGATLGQGVVSGAQQSAPILAAGVASGAGGGSAGGGVIGALGGWGGIAGMVLGAFKEGGYVTQPVGRGTASMVDFMNAPHFSEGGLTPGSVPVIAHENEAIVPLSRNRSIPVELAGNAGGGSTVQNIYMTVNGVTDADSFRRSRGQVESDLARAGQRSLGKNG